MLKRIVSLMVVLACILLPAGAFAQSGSQLGEVSVDLWPEYDKPSMLVIYHLTLPAGVALPAEVRLRIPAAAGTPNAVAARQADNSLVTVPYKQNPAGDWTELVIQAIAPELQIEYYDPGLKKTGETRHFDFAWPGGDAVDSFAVDVQQPAGASQMKITPGTATSRVGNDGLNYYHMNVGPLKSGQAFNIAIDYQKSSDELTASSMPVAPSAPIESSSTASSSLTAALPLVLGLLGVVLIAGGATWYWQSGRQRNVKRGERRPRRRSSESAQADTETSAGQIYCHQCGKRAGAGDSFCRACGTPLRQG
jgi:hypothetical protein